MADIASTLSLICDKLNEYLVNTERDPTLRQSRLAVLSNLLDQNSAPVGAAIDRVVMFLANIKHETTISTYNRNVPAAGDNYSTVAPPLYINLYVMLYANFQDRKYVQGLEMISRTISFFQQNPFFTHQNLPGLDSEIDKLAMEFTNLDVTDLNYLMGLAGVKYLPTTYYKIRLLPFAENLMTAETPAVRSLDNSGDTTG